MTELKAKGIIQDIETRTGEKDGKQWSMKIVKLSDGHSYSTFNALPDNWKKDTEVEFEYYMKGEYRNISVPGQKKGGGNISSILEVLAQNKLTIGLTEKIPHPSGEQYSSKEYTAMFSLNLKEFDPAKADGLMAVLQGVIDRKKESDIKK